MTLQHVYRLTQNGLVLDPRTRERTFNVYALYAVNPLLNVENTIPFFDDKRYEDHIWYRLSYIIRASVIHQTCCVTSCVPNGCQRLRKKLRLTLTRFFHSPGSEGEARGGYLTKFCTGRLRPEVQPLTLSYTILAEKVPLLYTYFRKSCSSFHVVLNK